MRWHLFWSPHAEDRLEKLLLNAPDPARLVAASRMIDMYLGNYPLSFGESRYDAIRVGFEHPLGVQYEVLKDVSTVIVHDVWRIDANRRD
jgi:hypothetical protein